ncbi:MAG TPA: hypothetical protein VLT88_03695, partial [Desulfosarcina sp.]|nr:hypothetical protein [Desulfosarcina sp.]
MKLSLHPCLLAVLSIATFITGLQAQNDVITYQGRVRSGGVDFTGVGRFKFALVTSVNQSQTARATATVSGGFVTIITPVLSGSGYVTAPGVSIIGGGGTGAAATAIIGDGKVTGYVMDDPGSGYTSAPTVVVDPPPEDILFTSYWSNDGTSVDGSEPLEAVSVVVTDGLFTARLGDVSQPNMETLDPGLFRQADLELRTWFDDGVNGFAVLDRTQPLTAVPYAMAVNMGAITDPTFIGSTDGSPLDFHVGGERGMRLQYSESGSFRSVNI